MQVHNFRIEGVNHIVLTRKRNVKRNGRHHTICAIRVSDSAQRVTPQAATTCDVCTDGLTGFVDVIEMDFGYPTWDDRTGRFS